MSNNISLWGTSHEIEDLIKELVNDNAETPLVRELTKSIALLRNFKKYNITIPVDEEFKKSLLDNFFQSIRLTDTTKRSKFFESIKAEEGVFVERLINQEKLNKLKKIVITQEVLRDCFLKKKSSLDSAFFYLIRVKDEGVANEIYSKLTDDGEDFGRLAKEHSTGPEAQNDGIVPPQPIERINPKIKSRLLDLKPGEISEPFELDSKMYGIIKLIKIESVQLTPQIEAGLREELFNQWLENEINSANAHFLP